LIELFNHSLKINCSSMGRRPSTQDIFPKPVHNVLSRTKEEEEFIIYIYINRLTIHWYLADLVAFSSTDSHRQLRSTTTRAAAIQRTRTQFGRRALSVCGPDVWNRVFLRLSAPSTPTRPSAVLSKLICSSLRLTINCFYFLFFIYFTIYLTM